MTLNIEIASKNGKDFRLTSDDKQIVIQRKHIVDPTKSPTYDPAKHGTDIRIVWKDWKWVGSLPHALDVIAFQDILESDATTLKELHVEIKELSRRISSLLD